MELVKIAYSPLPSAPKSRVIIIDEINAIIVLIICAPNVNDMLFL